MSDEDNAQDDEQRTEDTGATRPIAVLAIETGGCGACAQSVAALRGPRYRHQLAASGITLVSSPRQAEVVLVSGPLTSQSEPSVRRILDVVSEPQVLVAVGDCAINGCVFAGASGISRSAAEALDVHIELPGCPPTPASILSALVRAARLLEESGDGADSDDADDEDNSTDALDAEESEGEG